MIQIPVLALLWTAGPLFAQTAALQVVDSHGKVIGRYLSPVPSCPENDTCKAGAVVSAGQFIAVLGVANPGFVTQANYNPTFLHLTSGCSGPRYLRVLGPGRMYGDGAALLPPPSSISGGKLFIPFSPPLQLPFQSIETPTSDDYTQAGSCGPTTDTLGYILAIVDPTTVATPPFHIQ